MSFLSGMTESEIDSPRRYPGGSAPPPRPIGEGGAYLPAGHIGV